MGRQLLGSASRRVFLVEPPHPCAAVPIDREQARLRLLAGEVHVFTEDPEKLDSPYLLELLCERERARHDRFHFEKDRRLFRTSHALLRKLLAFYGELPASRWRFSEGPYGRPAIEPAHPWLRFNLSHCSGLVAVAIGARSEVGVDVEAVVAERATEDLAAAVMSPVELSDYRRHELQDRVERFFAMWTCKEAYIKARGMGVSLPLEKITVWPFDGPRLEVDPSIDDGLGWQLVHRDWGSHHLAVAASPEVRVMLNPYDPLARALCKP